MLANEERVLFDTAEGALIAVGDHGGIEYASASALRLLGWDDALIGRPLATIIPDRLLTQHQAGFGRYVTSGTSRLQGKTVRVPAKCRDGTECDVDLTIRVFRRPDGTKLVSASLAPAATGHATAELVFLERTLTARMYQLI